MEINKKIILLVDDEPDVLEFLSYNLSKENYEVYTASNGNDAITIASDKKPDMIILDVMMPEMDGIETCAKIKNIPSLHNTMIVFLTARGEDYSQIAGFDAGADDYITKPIKPKVLISRIKAILKRMSNISGNIQPSSKGIIQTENLVIDQEKFIVLNKGKEVILPKKEFLLLSLLASKPFKVFGREEILSHIWGNDILVGDRTIDVHIRKIREKIGDDCIKTIIGIGYKFEG